MLRKTNRFRPRIGGCEIPKDRVAYLRRNLEKYEEKLLVYRRLTSFMVEHRIKKCILASFFSIAALHCHVKLQEKISKLSRQGFNTIQTSMNLDVYRIQFSSNLNSICFVSFSRPSITFSKKRTISLSNAK